jgi:hypothetical protein
VTGRACKDKGQHALDVSLCMLPLPGGDSKIRCCLRFSRFPFLCSHQLPNDRVCGSAGTGAALNAPMPNKDAGEAVAACPLRSTGSITSIALRGLYVKFKK